MATEFVSWAVELARFKNALANRRAEDYFKSAREHLNDQKITFTKLGNIREWLEFLEEKAAEEAAGSDGAFPFFIAGS